jgi:phosphoserine aminotransferase
MKPSIKPTNPNFSSGPCSKRPGYDVNNLDLQALGRSHRAAVGKAALGQACLETSEVLGLPKNYLVGIVPASDTGAFEMAMWSLLGQRNTDVFSWESFGKGWVTDILNQLKLKNVKSFTADYGYLPDLSKADPDNDIVFTWNGTTSGVKVPNAEWIASDRKGLTICDATSAVFAMDMPWKKLDVVTFSWQKVLGGEGAHGVIILSPRAVERLESYTPPWPMPKIFRLTKNGKLIEGIFRGETINTPSMLCVADYLDAINWVKSIGGLQGALLRSKNNLEVIKEFVKDNNWINFLATDYDTISNTSICLILDLEADKVKQLVKLLAKEEVAFDIGSYRDAPAGLRIWGGATIDSSDLEVLMPWIKWAYHEVL